MRFSSDAVQLFAGWSADRNPLHVDERFARQTYFGRTIVHGALTALEALRHVHVASPDPVKRLDIEFRTAAAAGEEYEVRREVDGRDLVVRLNASEQLVLAIRAEMGSLEAEPGGRPSWASQRPTAQLRQAPA